MRRAQPSHIHRRLEAAVDPRHQFSEESLAVPLISEFPFSTFSFSVRTTLDSGFAA
jgi:hypothetical protein